MGFGPRPDANRPPTGKPVKPKKEILALEDIVREQPTRATPSEPKYVNKKQAPLCQSYQSGHCQSGKGDPSICPKKQARRHQCQWCLGLHPGSECGKVLKKGGKQGGGGKGGGKKGGGKGGRKW